MVPQKCKSYFTQIATFGKSTNKFNLSIKPYLKLRSDEHKISLRNWDCDKNKIVKHCRETDHNFIWDQKKVVDYFCKLLKYFFADKYHSSLKVKICFIIFQSTIYGILIKNVLQISILKGIFIPATG